MRHYDLSPLFRSTVGFDRLNRLIDTAFDANVPAYPPYNIEKLGEEEYRVTMAVAGFTQDEIDITQHNGSLVIKGEAGKDEGSKQYLHRGIAQRAFERRFALADHVNVVNANLADGLLTVDLRREVPEALKPRSITIESSDAGAKTIEQEAA